MHRDHARPVSVPLSVFIRGMNHLYICCFPERDGVWDALAFLVHSATVKTRGARSMS